MGDGGGRILVHIGGGRSGPDVVGAWWSAAAAWRDEVVMIDSNVKRPIRF